MDGSVLQNYHIIQFSSLNHDDLVEYVLNFLPLRQDRSIKKWVYSEICALFKKESKLRSRCINLSNSIRYINFLNSPFKFSYDKIGLFTGKDKKPEKCKNRDSNKMTSYFSYQSEFTNLDCEGAPDNDCTGQPVVLVKRLSWNTIEKTIDNDGEKKSSKILNDSKTAQNSNSPVILQSKTKNKHQLNDSSCMKQLSKRHCKRNMSVRESNNSSGKLTKVSQKRKRHFSECHNVPVTLNENNEESSSTHAETKIGKVSSPPTQSTSSLTKENIETQVFDSTTECICLFCKQSSTSHKDIQELVFGNNIAVHEKCMYFASGLSQAYQPDNEQNESMKKTHLIGFKIQDIVKEVKRGTKLACSGCLKKGACSGCVVRNCKRSYHLPCGLDQGAVCVFGDNFPLYCSDHRPKIDLSRWYPNLTAKFNLSKSCCICLDDILVTPKNLGPIILQGQCCSECWMHRDCIHDFSLSAGLHHIKCPLCGDRSVFLSAIKLMGVWIPDRDAAWELEEGAYGDLYNSTDPSCSLSKCLCKHGRDFFEKNARNKWFTLKCVHCLITGAHRPCFEAQMEHLQVPIAKKRRFVCEACTSFEKD